MTGSGKECFKITTQLVMMKFLTNLVAFGCISLLLGDVFIWIALNAGECKMIVHIHLGFFNKVLKTFFVPLIFVISSNTIFITQGAHQVQVIWGKSFPQCLVPLSCWLRLHRWWWLENVFLPHFFNALRVLLCKIRVIFFKLVSTPIVRNVISFSWKKHYVHDGFLTNIWPAITWNWKPTICWFYNRVGHLYFQFCLLLI